MKKCFYLMILCVFVCICCTSKTNTNYDKWNDNVIMPYAEAFNEVAKVSPIIGGDTETDWAVSQIDSIYQEMKSNKMSLEEKSANIHKMQSYMAYGITYFLSVIGCYQKPQEASDAQRICFVTDSLFNELQKTEYKDYEELCTFEWSSYFFYNLYFKLYNASMDDVYKPKKHLSDIIYLLGVAGALYEYRGYNDQSYRLSTIVEQSAFFMTMFPLIKSLQSEEHHCQTQDSILSYAHWFDAHTQPIATKVIENKLSEIKPISDKEYYEFMVEATKRKVCMLKILKQAIESRKKE